MDKEELQALIEEQKTLLENPNSESQHVLVGRKRVTVEIFELLPDDWQALVWQHAPRPGVKADSNVGFNQDTLPRNYPSTRIKVAGVEVDDEMWSAIYAGLKPAHRNVVTTLMWGVNVYDAILELADLGKAEADQESASQGNRESRRAASKGGNRRKSPATTTSTETSPDTL